MTEEQLDKIPDLNHVIDCFNNDKKWSIDSLNLDSNYVYNVEMIVKFIRKTGSSYLDSINQMVFK